jgi:HlyD family secretion protein
VASGSGQLIRTRVEVFSLIKKGQIVADLMDPDLAKRLVTKKAELRELEQNQTRQSELIERETNAKRLVLDLKSEDIHEKIRVLKNRLQWLEQRIKTLTALYDEGLLKEKKLADLRLERDNTQLKVAQSRKDLKHIATQKIELEQSMQDQLFKMRLKIDDVKRDISVLEKQREVTTEVRSPMPGRVVEILADTGQMVKAGQPVIAVQAIDGSLEVQLYVTAFQGKKVQVQAGIEFTPSTVTRDEYGFMLAKVDDVSEFPASSAGMMSLLNNRELVQSLLKKGPLVAIRGTFVSDPETQSGFKWSSRKGAEVNVTAGTLGAGEIVVKEQPPVTLALPILKRLLGVGE